MCSLFSKLQQMQFVYSLLFLLHLRLHLSASGSLLHQLLHVVSLLRQTVWSTGSTRKDVRALKAHTSHNQRNNKTHRSS